MAAYASAQSPESSIAAVSDTRKLDEIVVTGNPLNDAIVNLMGGKGTPEDIVKALEKTAANK